MSTTTTSALEQQIAEHDEGLFMIPDEVSAALRVSRGDLRRMRAEGAGPAYFAIGPTIRYLPSDVDAWSRARPSHEDLDSR